MDPEVLGTSEIERLFATTGRLVPQVTERERGVAWDGHIDVYMDAGSNHGKDDLLDQIRIQVKSEQKVPEDKSITYPVSVADIRIYSRIDPPTLYLVVRIGKDGTARKVYYHVFNKGDYKKLKLRSDGQKTISCPFRAFPTNSDKVEKLVLDMVEVKQERELPVFDPLEQEAASDPLLYNAEAVEFFGRDKEKEELRAFLDAPGGFLWWGIAGPGGAGKSRLAYEFCKALDFDDVNGWQSHWLESDEYSNLKSVVDKYHTQLLLVADDAQYHQVAIADFIVEQYKNHVGDSLRLRLLLIDRNGGEDRGENRWVRWLLDSCNNTYEVNESYYRSKHGILNVGHLTDQDILKLIGNYAEVLAANEKSLDPLPEGRDKELLRKLKELCDGDVQALYAMILTDAAMHEPDETDWNLQKSLDKYLKREGDLLKKRVATLTDSKTPDKDLLAACELIMRVATALGTSGDLTYKELEKLTPEALQELELKDSSVSACDKLLQVGLASVREDKPYVSAIRPDILGEHAILRFLENLRSYDTKDTEKKSGFFAVVLQEAKLLISFYLHLLQDNRRYLESCESPAEAYGKLLPQGLDLDEALKSSYAALIAEVFDWTLSHVVRQYLVKTLEGIVESGIEDKVGACKACNSLGYMYNMMGRYDEALVYYEHGLNAVGMSLDPERLDESISSTSAEAAPHAAKCYSNAAAALCEMGERDKALRLHRCALSIRKQHFDAEDPAVATSLHNIGYVYDKMGEYDKSLEYHTQALNIRAKAVNEKKDGSQYFNLSTSYSNIGDTYGHKGDYDNAMANLEIALSMREKKYGPEHSSVATVLDHIGNALAKEGKDLDDALAHLERALAIREKALDANHPLLATSCENIGDVYLKQEEYEKALEHFERGLSIAMESLGPEHPTTKSLRERVSSTRELLEG